MNDEVIALYDYQANDAEELSIKKNEVLSLLDSDNNWWKVRNSNMKIGLVPSNYLKKNKGKSFMNSITQKLPGRRGRAPSSGQNIQKNQKLLISDQIGNVPANLVTDSIPVHNQMETFISQFNYTAVNDDELSLVKGMRIVVLKEEADGWWLGKDATDGNNKGWFPSNYVSKESSNSQQSLSNKQVPAPAQQNTVQIVRCLYAFNSGKAEELAFEEEELLDVIDKPEHDPGWIVCRNKQGEQGLVPRNYVEVVNDTSATQNEPQISYDRVTPHSIPTNQNEDNSVNQSNQKLSCDWFFGSVTRSEAEHLLNQNAEIGQFLVRNSETCMGDFSISLKVENRIRHFKVVTIPNNNNQDKIYKIGQKKFENMEALLRHYKQHPIFTNDQGRTFLTTPLPR